MGIYDGYNPPEVGTAREDHDELPMYSGPTQVSYWTGRWCLRLLVLGFLAAILANSFYPQSEQVDTIVRLGLTIGVPLALLAQCLGVLMGFVGLFLPSRSKGRALWGIVLNGCLPAGLITLIVVRGLPSWALIGG